MNKYFMSQVASKIRGQIPAAAQQVSGQPQEQYAPQVYQAAPSYDPFSQLFQPQLRPTVTDIYQRGAMPNDLLARYNAMSQMLQKQQSAMVPRTRTQSQPAGLTPWMGDKSPNPYANFAQLFGGVNG